MNKHSDVRSVEALFLQPLHFCCQFVYGGRARPRRLWEFVRAQFSNLFPKVNVNLHLLGLPLFSGRMSHAADGQHSPLNIKAWKVYRACGIAIPNAVQPVCIFDGSI